VLVICAVYLLAHKRDGTLYLGVTKDLSRRIWEHKTKAAPGFSARYAVAREKALKKWRRAWKVALIEAMNPDWSDLYERLNA
jgi:putative endonuclease